MRILRITIIFSAIMVFCFSLRADQINRVTIKVPEKRLTDVLNSGIDRILNDKDALRINTVPGEDMRSWIGDGAITCSALLRMGINEPVRKWLDAATLRIGNDGAIAGATGSVQGGYVLVIRNYIDYTGDKAYLSSVYPKIVKILELAKNFRIDDSGKGIARNYSDALFVMRGLNDGAYLADLMGNKEDADWMRRKSGELRKSIYDSIDRGGFDPISSATAIVESGELKNMPKDLLKAVYDKYFNEFEKAAASGEEMRPELYCANIYFMMDERERGLAMMRHFAKGQAIKLRDYPGYINALRTMVVYEDDGKLILGEGLAPEWFDEGIEIKDMPTPYGKICYVLKKDGNVINYFVYGSAKPPKGVRFILPKELSGCKIQEMKAKQ